MDRCHAANRCVPLPSFSAAEVWCLYRPRGNEADINDGQMPIVEVGLMAERLSKPRPMDGQTEPQVATSSGVTAEHLRRVRRQTRALPAVRHRVRRHQPCLVGDGPGARPRSLPDGLGAVYRHARDFYLAGDAPRGCFQLGTAVTEANRDPDVRAVVEHTMPAFTATFAQRFERAVRARTGASPAVLDALIDTTIGVICARPD